MSRKDIVKRTAAIALVTLLAMSAGLEAQDRQRGRGGFRGGFGRFGNDTVASLLGRTEVQEELKLSDEQKTKAEEITTKSREALRAAAEGFNFREASEAERAELREKVEKVSKESDEQALALLKEDQQKRIREIVLQQKGIDALNDPEVVKALAIDEEQQAILKGIFATRDEKARELFEAAREAGGDGFREAMRKRQTLTEEAEKDAMAALKDDQKAKFAELKGKPFELRRGRPGDGDRRRRSDDNN